MTEQQLDDLELLALMAKYLEAHRRRGTTPTDATMLRYSQLVARVRDPEGAAA